MATAKTSATTAAKAKPRTAAKRTPSKRSTSTVRSNSTSRARPNTRPSSTAERAVLIPIGAALVARDRLLAGVNEAIGSYNNTAKAQAQLRKFERRGSTARNRLEREVRKTRVRVEREVRQTRGRLEREVRQTRGLLEKEAVRRRRDSEELVSRVQERVLSLI